MCCYIVVYHHFFLSIDMLKMDDKISNSLFDLQLDLENSLRLLTKKYNELSKQFADKKDNKSKVIGFIL